MVAAAVSFVVYVCGVFEFGDCNIELGGLVGVIILCGLWLAVFPVVELHALADFAKVNGSVLRVERGAADVASVVVV